MLRCGVLLVILVSCAPRAHGQLSERDLLTMPQIPSYPQFKPSPDGALMAYTIELAQVKPASGGVEGRFPANETLEKRIELWITDLVTGRTEPICCEDANASFPSWSPDGKHLGFYRSNKVPAGLSAGGELHDGDELAIWNRETRATKRYLKGSLATSLQTAPPLWLNTNRSVLVFTRPARGSATQAVPKSRQSGPLSKESEAADPSVRVAMTRAFARQNNVPQESSDQSTAAQFARSQRDAVIVDIATGEFRVVSRDISPNRTTLSPDRKTLFYSTFKTREPNSRFEVSDVHSLSLETFQDRLVFNRVTNYAGAIRFSWSPGGRFLAFPNVFRADSLKKEEFIDYILLDTADGSSRHLKADVPDHLAADAARRAIWSGDGQYVSMIRGDSLETWDAKTLKQLSRLSIPGKALEDGDIVSKESGEVNEVSGMGYSLIVDVQDKETLQTGFWKVWPASGRKQKLLEEDKSMPLSNPGAYQELVPDGSRLFFIRESVHHPAELFEADSNLREVRQVTHLGSVLDHMPMGHARLIKWLDDDGNKLRGALLMPANYEPGRRYPLIVFVYPWPRVEEYWVHRFGMSFGVLNMQLLAARGYAVLFPDMRTKPETFMHDIAKSVLPGIQRVIDAGIANAEEIGVMGHSDGGYATFALIVQSRMFKVAVVTSAWANMITYYSNDSGRRILTESRAFTATAWNDRNSAIENSPYFYLNRVQTPVLMIHGSEDSLITGGMYDEIFAALQNLGKEAVYVEYKGEGHTPGTYSFSHQLDLSDRIIAWFDKYLKAQAN